MFFFFLSFSLSTWSSLPLCLLGCLTSADLLRGAQRITTSTQRRMLNEINFLVGLFISLSFFIVFIYFFLSPIFYSFHFHSFQYFVHLCLFYAFSLLLFFCILDVFLDLRIVARVMEGLSCIAAAAAAICLTTRGSPPLYRLNHINTHAFKTSKIAALHLFLFYPL